MGKIIEITKYGRDKKGFRKGNIKPSFKPGVTIIGFITITIVCLLALFYLIQTNKTATFGFEIENYDKKITGLKEERAKLELRAARLRSTNQIKEKLEKLNMQEVDPTKISYYKMRKGLALKEDEEKMKK